MPNIRIAPNDKAELNFAHQQFVKIRGTLEVLVEGPPHFTGLQVTDYSYIVSDDFRKFLVEKNFPFTE